MWGIVLLIFFVAGSRQLSITEFSVPNVIESGEDVLLKCGYELNSNETGQGLIVKWWFTQFEESDDEPVQLYQRIAGQSPETAKVGNLEIMENDDILLKNVTPDSSGTYECEVSAIEDEKRQHADLIVFLKGELLLNITDVEDAPDEDDLIMITCETRDVAPYPSLLIMVNENTLPSNATVIDKENNTYDAINNVTISKNEADGAEISCELIHHNTTIEQYKISQIYKASELSTTEDFEDASTTEAAPGNRVIGISSSLLLVIAALLMNIIASKN